MPSLGFYFYFFHENSENQCKIRKNLNLRKNTIILEKSKIKMEAEQTLESDLRFVTMLAGFSVQK